MGCGESGMGRKFAYRKVNRSGNWAQVLKVIKVADDVIAPKKGHIRWSYRWGRAGAAGASCGPQTLPPLGWAPP